MFANTDVRVVARRFAIFVLVWMGLVASSAARANEYTMDEIVASGHQFFGATSGGLASVIEHAFASYGLPILMPDDSTMSFLVYRATRPSLTSSPTLAT